MSQAGSALVVVDPTAERQPAVERAAAVAGRLGLRLTLLACLHGGLPPRRPAGRARAARHALLARELEWLGGLVAATPGLAVEAKAVWDAPLHEAIIRETLRSEPRLVMKDTHYHSVISRALVTNTDWHLIRDCPAPLWLVRGGPWPASPQVAAFVDPLHERDRPAGLDRRILAEGRWVAGALGGALHAVHCSDTAPLVTAPGLPEGAGAAEAFAADVQAEHARALQALAEDEDIPADRAHLRSGTPAAALAAAARELDTQLVVMGAVSRSGLRKLFLGGTAEQLLDRLPCDVLVVKPAGFRTPVAYRPQAPDFMELH
jgi:universal stress protein E